MVFAACAASMRWMISRRMIVGMAAAGIARMTADGVIIGCRSPDPPGWSCHRRRSVSALGIEAGPANRIHSCCTGMATVGGCKLVAVLAGGMVVVELFRRRLDMVLIHGRPFPRSGLGLDARAAVEAGVIIHYRIVDHGSVDIGVVNDRGVDIHHGGIIPEVPAMPFPAYKPGSSIAVAIVDPAIKADVRPPIATVPAIDAAGIAPVTRGP